MRLSICQPGGWYLAGMVHVDSVGQLFSQELGGRFWRGHASVTVLVTPPTRNRSAEPLNHRSPSAGEAGEPDKRTFAASTPFAPMVA